MAALQELAGAQLTLHRFHDALTTTRAARRIAPADASLAVGEASLDMELGDYAAARSLLARFDAARALADDRRALALNPRFQAGFGDDARRRVARLKPPRG